MIFWPFGKNRLKMNSKDSTTATMEYSQLPTGQRLNNIDTPSPSPQRRRSRRATRDAKGELREPRKLQKRFSFSPDRAEQIHHPTQQTARTNRSSPPHSAIIHSQAWSAAGVAQTTNARVISSSTALPQAREWSRVPTLHRRPKEDMPRRKSSKRKREDLDREAEIKAMSVWLPKQSKQKPGMPSNRQSRNVTPQTHSPLGRTTLPSTPSPRPPTPSATPTADKHSSIKLKGMLSPHPIIRYQQDSPLAQSTTISGTFESPHSARRAARLRTTLSKSELNSKERINDLANDLTARDLRELMERDSRRRERKQIADQERLNRRLQRRFAKHDIVDSAIGITNTGSTPATDGPVPGQDQAEHKPGGWTAALERKSSNRSFRRRFQRPASLVRLGSETSQHPSFLRSPSLAPTDHESPERPTVETAQVARLSRANISPPSSPPLPADPIAVVADVSHMLEVNKQRHVIPTLPDDAYVENDKTTRQPQSWKTFFKRSSTMKRGPAVPSFSNTSRDSALSGLRPTSTVDSYRSSSGKPKRTMSRFREDLPEFPVSPPTSRYVSPEDDRLPPIFTGFPQKSSSTSNPIDIGELSGRRHDTPTSGYRSIDQKSRLRNERPTSFSRSTGASSPEPAALLSQSLASVDSEASWLSGKVSKKTSGLMLQHRPIRASTTSLAKSYDDHSDEFNDGSSFAGNSSIHRSVLHPSEMSEDQQFHVLDDTALPSGEFDEELALPDSPTIDAKWGAIGRRPTIIAHMPRVVSVDGILNTFGTDFDGDDTGTPTNDDEEQFSESPDKVFDTGRAISINLGKNHQRTISSGSAKKIDIRPRTPGNEFDKLAKVTSPVAE